MALGKSYREMIGLVKEPKGNASKRKRKRLFIPVFRETRVVHSVNPEKEMPGRMGKMFEHEFTDLYAPPDPMRYRKALSKPDLMGNKHVQSLAQKDLHLLYRAPYDQDAMRKVFEKGGLRQLIDLMCPYLSAERKVMLRQRMESLMHAKQREHDVLQRPPLIEGDKEHRARRLTRAEKRALREGKGKRVR